MTNDLVPEKHVDRNGVVNVKHVRRDKKPLTTRTLPAPLIASRGGKHDPVASSDPRDALLDLMVLHNSNRKLSPEVTSNIKQVSKVVATKLIDGMNREGFPQLLKFSAKGDPSNMCDLLDAYQEDVFVSFPQNPKFAGNRLQQERSNAYYSAIVFGEHSTLTKGFMSKALGDANSFRTPAHIDALREYARLCEKYWNATYVMDGGLRRDIPKDLVAYVYSGEHKTDDIMHVVSQHQTLQVPFIRGVLNGIPASLADGYV